MLVARFHGVAALHVVFFLYAIAGSAEGFDWSSASDHDRQAYLPPLKDNYQFEISTDSSSLCQIMCTYHGNPKCQYGGEREDAYSTVSKFYTNHVLTDLGAPANRDIVNKILCELPTTTTTSTTTTTTTTTTTSTTTTTTTTTTTSTTSTTTTTTRTTSTSTTSTTTTRTVAITMPYTRPPELLKGSMELNVSNAEKFVEEPNLIPVLASAIADLFDVNVTWIQNVRVTLVERRLSPIIYQNMSIDWAARKLAGDVEVVTRSGVKIDFDILVPQDGSQGEVVASVILERFEGRSIEEATELINKAVQSGALGGTDYDVRIVIMKLAPEEEAETTSPPEEGSTFPMFFVIMATSTSCSLVLLLLVAIISYRKCLKKKQYEISMPLIKGLNTAFDGSISQEQLFFPPDAISVEEKRYLLNLLSSLIDYSSPCVIISFDMGGRVSDCAGSGLGLYYLAAIAKTLQQHGIPCYSSVLLDETEGDSCLEFLTAENTSCKCLVVIETRPVFYSRRCLQYYYHAQKHNIHIERLCFDLDLPSEHDRWCNLGCSDPRGTEMRTAVMRLLEGIYPLPHIGMVQTSPGFSENFAERLNQKLRIIALESPRTLEKTYLLAGARSQAASRHSTSQFQERISGTPPKHGRQVQTSPEPLLMGKSATESPKTIRKKSKKKVYSSSASQVETHEDVEIAAAIAMQKAQRQRKTGRRSDDGGRANRKKVDSSSASQVETREDVEIAAAIAIQKAQRRRKTGRRSDDEGRANRKKVDSFSASQMKTCEDVRIAAAITIQKAQRRRKTERRSDDGDRVNDLTGIECQMGSAVRKKERTKR